ncbi:unnamed protein product [Mycena citricolor]|uniref:Cytochrome P450 n=1 Tax=Mycena citricolor TaxID=2018698 RepID=A0AAD2Q0X6_9AGAR|nr:unnamed protein product [Mycena citricolor]
MLPSRPDLLLATLSAVGVAGLLSVLARALRVSRRRGLPALPPGPRGIPLLGNLLDVSPVEPWLRFTEMGDKYGDITSLRILNRTLILVHSASAADALLSAPAFAPLTADRPAFPFAGALCGFDDALVLVPYGARVRRERKMMHRMFGTPAAVAQWRPAVQAEIARLLRALVRDPGRYVSEVGATTGGISMRIAYGHELRRGGDALFDALHVTATSFVDATMPGAWMVDVFPILRYWPSWLPGGGFHSAAAAIRQQVSDTVDLVFSHAKEKIANGSAQTSFLSTFFEEGGHTDYSLKWAAAVIHVGASDTTAAQLEGFFLAMSLYPECQAKAQAEIDEVVGRGRLPTMDDREQLPYTNALCKEVLRWFVSGPTGLPHTVKEEFVFSLPDGPPMLIPKGVAIIPNVWAMHYDSRLYENPMEFDPARYLGEAGRKVEEDPAGSISFGYGRRMCPGRFLADSTIFLACSALLSVFQIKAGGDSKPVKRQSSQSVSHPLPFECSITLRDIHSDGLIPLEEPSS